MGNDRLQIEVCEYISVTDVVCKMEVWSHYVSPYFHAPIYSIPVFNPSLTWSPTQARAPSSSTAAFRTTEKQFA